jgi:hypothetical protein
MMITDLSGTGWSCVLSSFTCTRSDALPSGTNSSYPPIVVTGNIPTNANGIDVNTVFVSGGGEINLNNDSDTDNANIIPAPDLVAEVSHQGSFAQGQTAVAYTLFAANKGGKTTTGTITLVDTLPAGLTATAISGTGWNCTLATLTCTTTNQIQGTVTSNPITLTINVDVNAPSSVTNTVTVSGGGETVTTDNSAADVTPILPPVVLTSFPPNDTITAGQSVSYTISISSVAPDPVVLSCTALPALATCSFNPPSVMGQGSTTLTINTTAPTRSAAIFSKRSNAPLYAVLLPFLGLLLFRREAISGKALGRLVSSATLFTLLFLAGCGGSGSSTPPPPPPTLHGGTPAGNYTITVTATDSTASLQGSTTVSLAVNWNGL